MQHFLIAGLGNPEQQYTDTRHNIGFEVVDALSAKLESAFEKTKLGWIADGRHKGKKITLLKYWLAGDRGRAPTDWAALCAPSRSCRGTGDAARHPAHRALH